MISRCLVPALCALILCSCATKNATLTRAPGGAGFTRARRVPAAAQAPRHLAAHPRVVGPVLPVPPPPPSQAPLPVVAKANRQAQIGPRTGFFREAEVIYPYLPDALYRLYAAPGEVSDLALQPGETVSAISAGDTVRWTIGKTTSGAGRAREVHVLIKPFVAGLTTDLVILTNRHVYHLLLASTRHTAMLAVSWRYPAQLVAGSAAPSSDEIPKARLAGLHFRYEIRGAHTPWRPVRVFDDGHKVYIQFARRFSDGTAPPLFVLSRTAKARLVNYRVQGRFYIVDHLFRAAELRFGSAPQRVVRIVRRGSHLPQRRSDSWF